MGVVDDTVVWRYPRVRTIRMNQHRVVSPADTIEIISSLGRGGEISVERYR
jgi:hypothetical protein